MPVLLVFTVVLSMVGLVVASCLAQVEHYNTLENYYKKEARVEFGKINSILSIETKRDELTSYRYIE